MSEVTTSVVAAALEESAQAELARDAAEQLSRYEVDGLRGGEGLPSRIALQCGQTVSRVARRVTVDRVVVQDTQDLGHRKPPR